MIRLRAPAAITRYVLLVMHVSIGLATAGAVRAETQALDIKGQIERRLRDELKQQDDALRQLKREAPQAGVQPDRAAFKRTVTELKQELRRRQHLLRLIHKTEAQKVPQVLVDLYVQDLTEPSDQAYPYSLESYLLMLGPLAVGPLEGHYETAPFDVKEEILMAAGRLGAREGLPMVRKGLAHEHPLVRRSAITALRLIQGTDARDELFALVHERDAMVLKHLVGELRRLDDPRWADAFFTAIEDGRLPLSLDQTCVASEDSVGSHLDLMLRALQTGDLPTRSCAMEFLAPITRQSYVARLHTLLPNLLKAQYHAGATIGMAGLVSDPASWPEQAVWDSPAAHTVLQRISITLSADDLQRWLQYHRDQLLPRLYLEHLLAQQDGRPVPAPEPFAFQIDVRDAAGSVLSSGSVSLAIGQDAAFEVTARTPDALTYHCRTRLALDRAEWRLVLERWLIDLKPYGVGFDAQVPFGGAYEIRLEESRRHHETLTWRIRHVE